jgi:UDP-N-acetylmuramoylalanine--D-glutamate ligase
MTVQTIYLADVAGATYAVMGLGASGLAAAEALVHSGARVLAWDDNGKRRDAAANRGIGLSNLARDGLDGAQALVLSPGIPHVHPAPHPVAAKAQAADIPIISDLELLARSRAEAFFIGITGTNGKSTVTALLGHIFETAGREAAIGGNLGPAALTLPELGADGTYILEISSYQIELISSASFDVAVLVNISPDHLDRHGGMEGYIAAKETLFARTRGNAVAVISVDDPHCRAIGTRLFSQGALRVIPISGNGPVPGGVWADNGTLMDGTGGEPRVITALAEARALPGAHNHQNAAAAAAAALAAGIDVDAIAQALLTYPGLPHRQEFLRRIGRVAYINDSKATNPDAALRALESYDAVYWIAGGLAKDGGFEALTPAHSRIRRAFLIGDAADAIAHTLAAAVPHEISGNLAAAVTAAHEAAQAAGRDAVVLLSPACASFDQFTDFAARGTAFRRHVTELPTGDEGGEDD